MPTQKYYNLVDQKKDGILRAMGEELLEHSYQEITVSRIIERAGISRASFYSYFKDKEDMLGCIFQRLKEDTSERLLEHVQEEKGDALKGISRFLDYLLEDKRGQSVCRIFHSLHREPECRELMGLSLRNVSISLSLGTRVLYEEFGEMLFTHFGVSGPLILSASSYVTRYLPAHRLTLSVDLKPALTIEQLDRRILRDWESCKNRMVIHALEQLLPAKLIPVVIARSKIAKDKRVNEITRSERTELAKTIKALTFTITGTRPFSEAIITQGGVSVREVDASTMESKLVPGLYLAGEMLDVDGLTGGYNLQIAWSTGYLAGCSVPNHTGESGRS